LEMNSLQTGECGAIHGQRLILLPTNREIRQGLPKSRRPSHFPTHPLALFRLPDYAERGGLPFALSPKLPVKAEMGPADHSA
jgi:hypothetical protein